MYMCVCVCVCVSDLLNIYIQEINPEYSLEGLMLKLQYFGHLMWTADSLEKSLMLGKIEGKRRRVLGARVRHSACGKGHEQGGSTYAKAGSSLRSPPGNPQASTPITRACLLYYFVLSPTPLTLGGLSPTTSFGEGVNLELQLIIIPGRDRSVSTYKLLWRFSGLPDRLVWPHVIAHSLPTVRGTRCFKSSKNRFLRKVRKLLV